MTSNAIDLLRPAIAAEDNGTKKHSRSNENEDSLFGEFLNEESSDKPDPEPRTRELRLPDFAPNFIVQQPLLNISNMSNMPGPTASPLTGPGGTGNTPLPQPPELPQQAEAIERPEPHEPKPGESRPDASKEVGASKPETNKETRQEERAESAKATEARTEKTSDSGNASTEGNADESGSEESNAASNAIAENFLFDGNSEGEIADEELTKKFEQAKANQATQPANPATQTDAPVQAKTATVTAAADANATATAASAGTATNATNAAQAGQSGAPTGPDAAVAGVTGTSATDATTQTAQTEKSAEAKRMKAPPPVPKQVLQSLKDAIANGDNEIRIRLDPPELGDMKLFLQMDGDKVRVVLETSNDLAKRSLEESLDDLRQMLEDEGIEVGEFVLRDESENPEANADQWAGENERFGLPGGNADSEEEEAATAAELQRASQAYGLFNNKQVNMVA